MEGNANISKIFQNKAKQTPSSDNSEKLKMMVEYIEQDGYEKANEIDIKTDEMCRIIIAARKLDVDKYFEMKKQKTLQDDKLVYSKLKNESRLYFLNGKKQIVDQLVQKVKRRYSSTIENPKNCHHILAALILQAAVKILEPIVILRVEENDYVLILKILPFVRENYAKITGLPVEFIIDELHPLPVEAGGGVQLRTPDNRIYVNNIISKRILLLVDSIQPIIRMDLFQDKNNTFRMSNG